MTSALWRRPWRDAEDGFSLPELLVAIAISTVVGIAIMTFVVGINRSGRFSSSTSFVLDEARRATDLLQREARGADCVEPGSDPDTLVLDLDPTDPCGSDAADRVTFQVDLVAGTLTRTDQAGTRQIAAGIDPASAPVFAYIADGTTAAPVSTASQIDVSLRFAAQDQGGGASQPVELTVRLRNAP